MPLSAPGLVVRAGGCHCGAVRFEIEAAPKPLLQACTCSICRMTGHVHLTVPASRFRLIRGADALTEYRFNTGVARHLFCPSPNIGRTSSAEAESSRTTSALSSGPPSAVTRMSKPWP